MISLFRERELARLQQSGWATNPTIRSLIENSGLPSPTAAIADFMDDERWITAERAERNLRARFDGFRFSDDVTFGLLLVPSPRYLDTRGRIPDDVRASQHPDLTADFVDPALDLGVDLSAASLPWTPFISVVGAYGISAGSYDDVVHSPGDRFEVDGVDTRETMTRQLWGARLLQSPPGVLPDSDFNDTWTFTLFPGEPLAGGQAPSATVLKGRVRFRTGKADRGIGSARVSPAIRLV